jgi:hypothetical protein
MEEQNKPKEVLTTVTSVAQEEIRTGEKIEVPNAQKLVELAHASFIKNKIILANSFPKLSSRQKNRVFLAALEMPMDSVPVHLKTAEEQKCFGVAQRLISDRFIILQDYIHKEYQKAKAKELQTEQQTNKENENG